MPLKASTHVFKNMIRDVNPMSTNPSSLYNALNIRFTSDNELTYGSITNEKGTQLINSISISGTYLSHYIVDDNIMLFTLLTSLLPNAYSTNIYRIKFNGTTWVTTLVAPAIDLNMDFEHPLEFTSYYEGEDVVKIYWVDGKNQLRFMNIYGDYTNATDNDFNVLPTLLLEEIVNVEQINGNGIFPAGVIQYAFTYINKLGAESNIFYVTKLKSIQYEDRAGHPQRTINCCFKITIENLDTSFDYVRCYQLIRTTLDELPVCKILNEVPVNKNENGKITIIDTNIGATYDATALLFPKYPIIPYTLELKSNTLFLGNIKETPLDVTDSDIDKVRRYFNKYATYPVNKIVDGLATTTFALWPILRFNNLNTDTYECIDKDGYIVNTNADIIRTFKSRETYRIGVQLQDTYGCWTEPIYLKDIKVNCKLKLESTSVTPISLMFDVSRADTFPTLSKEFRRFRFLMVNPTATDRETFDLGIIVPTMFEVSDRIDNVPFSYNSWYIRPQGGGIEYRNNVRIPDTVTDGLTGETLAACGSGFYGTQLALPSADSATADVNLNIKFSFTSSPWLTTSDVKVKVSDCNVSSSEVQLIDNSIGYHGNNYVPLITIDIPDGTKDYTLTNTDKLQVAEAFALWLDTLESGTLYKYITQQYGELTEPKLSTLVYNQLFLQEIVVKGRNSHHRPLQSENYMYTDISISILFEDLDVTGYYIGYVSNDNSLDTQTCRFYIDHSVLNLYSPVIDDDYYVVDNNRMDVDIIGYANISLINENVFISMKTSGAGSKSSTENKNNIINIVNTRLFNINSKVLYYDTLVSKKIAEAETILNYNNYIVGKDSRGSYALTYYVDYLVAPWHKPSFNNEDNTYGDNRSAVYERKVFGRMFNTDSAHYFNNPTLYKKVVLDGEDTFVPIEEEEYQTPDILKICNNTTTLKTFMLDNVLRTYLPNVDIARSFAKNEYDIPVIDGTSTTTVDAVDTAARGNTGGSYDSTKVHLRDREASDAENYKRMVKSSDPIQIRYVSDNHILIPFNRKTIEIEHEGQPFAVRCFFSLPNLSLVETDYTNSIPPSNHRQPVTPQDSGHPSGVYYPKWDEFNAYIDYDCYLYDGEAGETPERITTDYPYVFIAELHREVLNKYGGDVRKDNGEVVDVIPPDISVPFIYDRNDPVLISNVYIPISESIDIATLESIDTISTTYGDTWYGRWDCLKTQEMTADDLLSVHDYISVMIESHINLNGRYDEYRNYSDWTIVNAELANKFNPVYNQMDNFWNYRVVPAYVKSYIRPNQITWSLAKSSGSLVDEWTKVTEAAVYEMDGTKGSINKIINYKDNLLVFQDKGLSQLLYNEQMLITTTEGVPVEISNNQKVTGKRVLYENTGCVNKWSICSTQDALFFIDNYNKGIYAYNPESRDTPITNMTAAFGFDTFMKKENSLDVWNPEDFTNFVTYLDSLRKDVYFINKTNCLGYSSLLNGFTSFYSYEQTPAMFNYQDRFFSIRNGVSNNQPICKVYEMFADKYNNIFGEVKSSIIEFIDTGQLGDLDGGSMFTDKTFTTISYIQDAFDVSTADNSITDDYIDKDYTYLPNRTFNTLRVHTPFLNTGTITLGNITTDGSESNLLRKFRTWNISIPRCASTLFNSDELDRIRNNWAKFKLTFTPTAAENTKIELFGINIYNLI